MDKNLSVSAPTPEALKAIWDRVKESSGRWSELEGSSEKAFMASWGRANLLVLFPFGVGMVKDLRPGHCCSVHALFWDKSALRNIGLVSFALFKIIETFNIVRVECVVPYKSKGVRRLIKRIGFVYEGPMKNYYKGTKGVFSGARYSVCL